MDTLCRLFGLTRQALWKQQQSVLKEEIDHTAIISEVRAIRQEQPRLGGRKLQIKLEKSGISIGRDALFGLLRESGLLIHRSHRRVITTYSKHWMKKWSNLIKGIEPTHPDQIWVSDITYIEVKSGPKKHMYLSLITDAYTHEIVGYALHDSLDAQGPIRALKMAVESRPQQVLNGLIHHSDRGAQYCCHEYVSLLQRQGMLISMTEKGDPYENAIAERINGILKTEWLYHMTLKNEKQVRAAIDKIIHTYNHERPHESIDYMTPVEARRTSGPINKRWKNYWRLRQQRNTTVQRQL